MATIGSRSPSPLDRISLVKGDITTMAVDAIVNAANSELMGGGGVDGAIHEAAGPQLLDACHKAKTQLRDGLLPTGQAVLTPGYYLPARNVIHCVGPIYPRHGEGSWTLLASCYRNALRLAREHELREVAFPSISTGAFACPLDKAAEVAIQAVLDGLTQHPLPEHVTFVLFDSRTLAAYQQALDRHRAARAPSRRSSSTTLSKVRRLPKPQGR